MSLKARSASLKYQKEILVGVLIAVVLYFLVAWTVGVATAVPTPAGYFDWYRANNLVWLGLLVWSLCTVYPAAALPSLIVTFVGIKVSSAKWLPVCYAVIALYLAYFFYGQVSLIIKYPQFIELNGYKVFVPNLVVPASIFLGGFLSTKCLTKRAARAQ